jgi:CHAD domain-containing protein
MPATDSRSRPTTLREIETKFDIPPDYKVPGLSRFAGKGGRIDVDTVQIMSTYYDTPAMDLLGYRITVRRRSGTADTGWQVKVPGTGFRTELHWSSRGYAIPKAITALLTPFVGTGRIAPAIRLEVRRVRHRVYREDGELIAEIAQDDVRALSLGVAVRAPRWQELEAELGPAGDEDILTRLGKALRKTGAVASTSRSKLARAAFGIGNELVASPRQSAGDVLSDYIGAQVDALVGGHFAVRYDIADSVHQARVACRRLRSTLGTFGDYFDASAPSLAEQLQWYAGVLGAVRDLEVLQQRLDDAIRALPTELVVGPIAKRIDEQLTTRSAAARAELLAVQEGAAYRDLLEQLRRWNTEPPFTGRADRPASALADAVRAIEHKLRKRLDVATRKRGTDDDMHRARKAGKRARYAAEATDGEASEDVKRAKALQDLLGEFQDSVVATELLDELARAARERGEDIFSYGILIGEQRARAAAARAQASAF